MLWQAYRGDFRHAIAQSQTATMQNRALLVRDSCKILRATSITNTLACQSIFNAQWRKTCRILQRSHTVKYDLAAKPRLYCIVRAQFRFKFIRCYVANFIKFTRVTINFVPKFYAAEHCKHSLAKHAACSRTANYNPHKTPRAKQLCRAVHDLSAFGV